MQAAALPLDVQAIFLLLIEGGLMANETLLLNMGDVTISRTGGLLRVGDPPRPYPLTTMHTPATIPVVLTWYQARRAAGAVDHEPLFLTRQHNRRSLASLVPWWTQMFGGTGLTRRQVWQARRAEMMARYPTITPSLLGAHGAPVMRADALRQVLVGGTHDA